MNYISNINVFRSFLDNEKPERRGRESPVNAKWFVDVSLSETPLRHLVSNSVSDIQLTPPPPTAALTTAGFPQTRHMSGRMGSYLLRCCNYILYSSGEWIDTHLDAAL